MRFRPVNSASAAMQSSAPVASMDAENLTPSRFNSEALVQDGLCLSPKPTRIASPALKKFKVAVQVNYPGEVEIPSKSLIRALYESAVSQEGSHQNHLDDVGSGLLSLEEVLLPAVAREEENALKKIQAKAQRDTPEAVETLKMCRRAIYECVESGIVSARAARLKREAEEKQHQERLKLEHEEYMERLRVEREEELNRRRLRREELQKAAKERTKHEMKKKLPKNVEMWQEVAFLMTELAKIRKEERMWAETEANLDVEIEQLSKQQNPLTSLEDETEIKTMSTIGDEVKERVESAVEDIGLSSLRIRRASQLVANAIDEANVARSELFTKYTKDHQFHGYAGVNDPKSLIRILSQD